MVSFLELLKPKEFQWTDLIVPALTAATTFGAQIPGMQATNNATDLAKQKWAFEQETARQDRLLALGKLMLDAQYPKGGGVGAATIPIVTGVEAANAIANMAPVRQSAYNNLMSGLKGL